MGLFDGQVKSFAGKISSALRGRANVRRKIAGTDTVNAKQHHLIALTLDDVAEVIDEVANAG